jgi:hypothetical protein
MYALIFVVFVSVVTLNYILNYTIDYARYMYSCNLFWN